MATLKRKNQPEVKEEALTPKVKVVVRSPKKAAASTLKKAAPAKAITKSPESKPKSKAVRKVVAKAKSTKTENQILITKEAIVSETVFVPSTASLRLLEKLEIYKLWYEHQLPRSASKLARVSGYTFLFLGALFASYTQILNSGIDNSAAVICGDESTCVDVSDKELPADAPLITFLNTVPTTLTGDVDVAVRNERTGEAIVYLEGIESGKKYNLTPIETISENERKYLIVFQNLEAGSYFVKAKVEESGVSYEFTGSQFKVAGKAATKLPEQPDLPSMKEEYESATSSTTTLTTMELSAELVDGEVEIEVENATQSQDNPFAIGVESLADSTFLRVKTGDFTPNEVAVYTKPSFADNAVLLGQATLVQGEWIFSLSAIDMPRFEHQLFAQFVVQGLVYKTPLVSYLPAVPDTASLIKSEELKLVTEKVELSLTTAELNIGNRSKYYSYISSTTADFFAANNESAFASVSEIKTADRALGDIVDILDSAMLRYAAAVQGDKKYLLTLASLQNRSLYQSYLAENGIKNPIIETLLSQRLQTLRDRVKEEEERIMAETNELTARDTDNDGIGDFDEIAVFGSEPDRTDTDRDGVIDGVEVVTGSNPAQYDVSGLPSAAGSLAELINPQVIEIKSVEGVKAVGSGVDSLFLLVRGKTVPHATVWLEFPSLSTTGFIKANAEGVFAYTLENVIPNGKHSVIAMLGDAKGNLAAVTTPVEFTVSDNKLVASVLSGEGTVINKLVGSKNFAPITTAAVALVAFGFLLLMLSGLITPKVKGSLRAVS